MAANSLDDTLNTLRDSLAARKETANLKFTEFAAKQPALEFAAKPALQASSARQTLNAIRAVLHAQSVQNVPTDSAAPHIPHKFSSPTQDNGL